MNKIDDYLNFTALSLFFEKLKTFFATKKELSGLKGEKGDKGDTGSNGVSVSKVEQTSTSTSDGGTNEITVTLSDGTTSTFYVKNGSKGATGLKEIQAQKEPLVLQGQGGVVGILARL